MYAVVKTGGSAKRRIYTAKLWCRVHFKQTHALHTKCERHPLNTLAAECYNKLNLRQKQKKKTTFPK